MSKDYYKILEVNENSTLDEIKKSYRNLSKKYHPDINPDSEDKFKEISEAYSILSNESKRKEYDDSKNSNLFGGWNSQSQYAYDLYKNFFKSDVFSSDFENFRAIKKAPNLVVKVKISFKDSFFGGNKNLAFTINSKCAPCDGTGDKDKKLNTCESCKGNGFILRESLHRSGMIIRNKEKCITCLGEGILKSDNLCNECNGNGFFSEKKNISIEIPIGVEKDMYSTYHSQGNYKPGFERGDLIVQFSEIINDTKYYKYDYNLILDHEISKDDLDKEFIEIPYIDGSSIKIKPTDENNYFVNIIDKKRMGFANVGSFIVRLKLKIK